MIQQESWYLQQITLLRTHQREWNDYAVQAKQARGVLLEQYRFEKAGLYWRENALEWAAVLKRHNKAIISLTVANKLKEEAMSRRQKQESLELGKRFKQE